MENNFHLNRREQMRIEFAKIAINTNRYNFYKVTFIWSMQQV